MSAICALCWSDRLEETAAALAPGIAHAQRHGSAPMFVQLSTMGADAALRAGDLDVAEDYAQRALELGRELGVELFATMWLPVVLLERGRVDAAAQLLEPLRLDAATMSLSFGVVLLAHRGRVPDRRGSARTGAR